MYCNSCHPLPCCCSDSTISTTTTTTTLCPNRETCVEAYDSDCIIYNSTDLKCYGVISGMTITEVLKILINLLPICTTTTSTTSTTTTTTTTAPPCFMYIITYSSGTVAYSYINCAGSEIVVDGMTSGSTSVCAQQNSVQLWAGAAFIEQSVLCE